MLEVTSSALERRTENPTTMPHFDVRSSAVALGLLLTATHCQKSNEPRPAQGGFPSQGSASPATGGGQTPGAPTLAAAPAPATPPAGALSSPNPLALPCASDAQCLTHRCNTAFGKCAWPCQTDNDCIAGSVCIAPTCLPKLQ